MDKGRWALDVKSGGRENDRGRHEGEEGRESRDGVMTGEAIGLEQAFWEVHNQVSLEICLRIE
jgi:hypothetical protein